MNDLARSLVDAAHAAYGAAFRNCTEQDPLTSALVAALEELAEQWDAERRDVRMSADVRTLAAITVSVNKLRKLAAAIREGR